VRYPLEVNLTMTRVNKMILSVLKGIIVKVASKVFLEWLIFWVAEMIVESTKTTKDDEFLAKMKEIIKD
jgi:hypothetical protein